MESIWEELGPKFKVLLEMGRSGVIASLLAASQRLDTHAQKVYNSKHLSSSSVLISMFWKLLNSLSQS